MNEPWRLLPLRDSQDHLWNMAVDDMLLEESNHLPPTLRFYGWSAETLSIGYFQKVERVVEEFQCVSKKLQVVRRVTGGGLVLHGKDLTLSLVLPEKNPFFPERVTDSYRRIHEILRQSLQKIVPGLGFTQAQKNFAPRSTRLCFEEPTCFDIGLDDRKIIGSSQRRRQGGLLHQTAMFVPADPAVVSRAICQGFASQLGVSLEPSSLTPQEIRRATQLIKEKYSKPAYSFTYEHLANRKKHRFFAS